MAKTSKKRTFFVLPKWSKQEWLFLGKRIFLAVVLVMMVLASSSAYQEYIRKQEQAAFEKADKTEFIQIIGETARDLAAQNDLYASVMVAQAILESDWGQSTLTKEANNLFGIKGSYKGESYQIETAEDDGTGTLHTVMAEFRKYPSYHFSLEDNAQLLANGLIGDTDFYSGTWKSNTKSYKEATAYLQGRYATDTAYASKLDSLIEQYDLTQYDTK